MKNVFYVPRLLVKHHLPHPELYGETLVELLNGMITDCYTDEENGRLFTITNDEELIKDFNLDIYTLFSKQKIITIKYSKYIDKDVWVKFFWENIW